MSSWEPIETAPKEEVFLAFAPHSQGGYVLAACRNMDGWVVDTVVGKADQFTHWMPLPPAPAGEN